VYVQLPVSVLEQLMAIRVHVDECTAENGPLRVVPESHCDWMPVGRRSFDHLAMRWPYRSPGVGPFTSSGVLTAHAPESEFGENRHVLSPLFYAAHELITDIRSADGIG
jgi:hypothetical protein